MIKQILYKTVLRLVRSCVIAAITSIVASIIIAGGDIETVAGSLMALLFLLPSFVLYHIGFSLKLKRWICDLLYMVPTALLLLLWAVMIIMATSEPYDDGGFGFSVFFFYLFVFAGVAAYLGEINFRNRKFIKELHYYEDQSGHIGPKRLFEQIFPKTKVILIRNTRSYIVAVIIIVIASTGVGFINRKLDLAYIFYGLFSSLCIIPAIIVYHITAVSGYKRRIRDAAFFITVIVTEFLFLPFALKIPAESKYELKCLPIFAMAIVGLGAIFVYNTEIIFAKVRLGHLTRRQERFVGFSTLIFFILLSVYYALYVRPNMLLYITVDKHLSKIEEGLTWFSRTEGNLPDGLAEVVKAGHLPEESEIYYCPMKHLMIWATRINYKDCEYAIDFKPDKVTISIPDDAYYNDWLNRYEGRRMRYIMAPVPEGKESTTRQLMETLRKAMSEIPKDKNDN